MHKDIFNKIFIKYHLGLFFVQLIFLSFCFLFSSFTFSVVFAKLPAKGSAKTRAYTKHFKQSFSRAGTVVNLTSPPPAVQKMENKPIESAPKVDENALNEAKSVRNFRTSELSRLKAELNTLQAEMKKSGQCMVDGRQMTIAQYKAKVSSVKAFSKTDKVAKINAEISDKKNVIAELEKRIGEKEATAKKMIMGTVATSTLAVAGTAGLGVAIADLVKTKMSAKNLQDGKKVCGKYGLLVK